MIARFLPVLAVAALLVCFGCRKATIASYRIPKEQDPDSGLAPAAAGAPAPARNSMAGAMVPTADGAGLTWTAPARWSTKPGSAMRKGSYAVPGAGGAADGDLSITAFPGDVGGELANVNRWRGQVQLAPVSDAELPDVVSRSSHDGLQFVMVDFAGSGADAKRILGAMVPYNGATWFFKLEGPTAVVANAKSEFRQFLQSVKPAAATP